MIGPLLVLLLAAPSPAAPSAGALLRAPAATAPACRTSPAEGQLVRAELFSPASERCPVATVGDESIPLRELASALELRHVSRSPHAKAPARPPEMDFGAALDRLIAGRLIVQEAREMQLDQAPEFRAELERFKGERLRALLQRDAVKGVKPDPAEVERLYAEAVREWKLASVLLEKEEDAKAFQAALGRGEDFGALARRFVSERKGRGGGKAEFAPRKQMVQEVAQAAAGAKPGVPTGPVRVPAGWVFFRVDGTRVPKGVAAARAEARERSLSRMQHEAIRRFYQSLARRWARVDDALLREVDFEAGGEAGFAALLADQRPLATVAGEPPLTVGDLGRELAARFFHGLAGPIREKRVNVQKQESFEKLLGARLFAKEAAARRLEQTPAFLAAVEERERALAFDTFVQKVIMPDLKVTEDEGLRDYEARKAEFTPPEMVKLDGIAFSTTEAAQVAFDRVRAGTDFGWLRANAPGQLPADGRSLVLDGRTVSLSAMPAPLAKALAAAREGEHRLYAPRDGEVYLLKVVERTPAVPQPYVEVREGILRKLYSEKIAQGIRDYADKLRKVQRVEVLITRVTP